MTATEARLTRRHASVAGGGSGIGFGAAVSTVAAGSLGVTGLGVHHPRRGANIDPMPAPLMSELPPVGPGSPS